MAPTVRDVVVAPDPVAAVLDAHAAGDLLALRTSGTTSRPRAVVRTTHSWVTSFPHLSRLTEVDTGSRVWVPGPLTSTMNLFAAVHSRWAGASLVDTPDDATHVHLTPSALVAALRAGAPIRGVHVVVAGDRLPRALARRAQAAGARVAHYYGAAELSFVAWGTAEDDLRPFPGAEVRVRGGVIRARSPYLALGYLGPDGRPCTEPPFRVDDDGYATVGDRGCLDAGVLTVTGRGCDVVLTGGVTVLVDDVERVLRRSVDGDVVVVGVPHPRLGAVVAAVVPDAAAVPTVRRAARAELAPAQRPRRWFRIDDLPLTAGGKLDRAAVADLARTGRLTPVTAVGGGSS